MSKVMTNRDLLILIRSLLLSIRSTADAALIVVQEQLDATSDPPAKGQASTGGGEVQDPSSRLHTRPVTTFGGREFPPASPVPGSQSATP